MRLPAVLLVLLAAAWLAPAAFAHADVISATPRDGETVPQAPTEVRVLFDDPVSVGPGNAVVAGDRTSVLAGKPRVERAGRELVLPLQPLVNGDYSARWRIVSDDGHLESGVLAFLVGPPQARAATVPIALIAVVLGGAWLLHIARRLDLVRPRDECGRPRRGRRRGRARAVAARPARASACHDRSARAPLRPDRRRPCVPPGGRPSALDRGGFPARGRRGALARRASCSWRSSCRAGRTPLAARLSMTAAAHLMRHRYRAYNQPLTIAPPR